VERQAAQELGQWTEKQEISGPDGGLIEQHISRAAVTLAELMSPEELEELRRRASLATEGENGLDDTQYARSGREVAPGKVVPFQPGKNFRTGR
jgi:hypothetical protein